MTKKIYGAYPSMKDAELVVANLIKDGTPTSSILVLSDQEISGSLSATGVEVGSVGDDNNSLWSRFKHFFGFNGYDEFERVLMDEYSDDIAAGKTLIFVEQSHLPKLAKEIVDNDSGKLSVHLPDNATNEDIVRLVQEHLCIDKESVLQGEVRFRKIIKETNETVTVPVMHEELVIEKIPFTNAEVTEDDFEGRTYTIPLMEEHVSINKVPVVTAEYRIGKKSVLENRAVAGTVRGEELEEIDKDGQVISVKK